MSETLEKLQGAVADRYQVERELGRGGMATVFLATDVRHERRVAIKVLHPDLAATIGAERFEREIKLAAKLQHPHILGLYDSGQANGLLYYVMPFIEGESVRDKLDREKQLSVDEALQITLEVADALGYAHSQNIIHRDIKPENVMMSNGHALVADFGIARARTEAGQQKLTQTGMAVGTPVYMSPEQSTGEEVGPSADIYSLGCMLYEMLAGEPPFNGPNQMAIMAKHAMEAVPSVRVVRPSVPEEVEEAILASMEKAVADRPRTAAEFCAILGTPLGATATRRVTMRMTATRRIPSGAQRAYAENAQRSWWRRPWAIGGAAVATIGVAAAAAYAAIGGGGAGDSRSADPLADQIAVLYFKDGSPKREFAPVAVRITESLITELSGIRGLTRVVSANGVAPFRDADVTRDSIARALKVGTLVEGTIEPDGAGSVLITTTLYDGQSGARLGSTPIAINRDSLFTAEGSVVQAVSTALRASLGKEIESRQMQAGTSNLTAWTMLNRAEAARREALRFGYEKPDSAHARLVLADSLLRLALDNDGKWIEPALARAQVAYDHGRLTDGDTARRWLDTALVRIDDALRLDRTSTRALALRGTVRYETSVLETRDATRKTLLESARADLEEAVRRDPSLVLAYATLTFLYYDLKEVPSSLKNARLAYQNDEFLTNSSAILDRLFWGSYDTELFKEAKRWCVEGHARFPGRTSFTFCSLWLQLAPDSPRDIGEAWRLAARIDSLAGGKQSFESHLARMIVGGIIGQMAKEPPRVGGPEEKVLLDSARNVLVAARADRTVDPGQELPGYEAIMRTRFGDFPEALNLLSRYIAVNPTHSFEVGGDVHWWWRAIRAEPRFVALKGRQL